MDSNLSASSVVITGTGFVTAAGIHAEPLLEAISAGRSWLTHHGTEPWPSARVSPESVTWTEAWQSLGEHPSWASQLAVTAASRAIAESRVGSSDLDRARAATVAVARDDWTEEEVLARALARAPSTASETPYLFELADEFYTRSRWSVGYGLIALSQFSGPSAVVDPPTYGGLSGLRQSCDLIESGESDAVLLVGLDTILRTDTTAAIHRMTDDQSGDSGRFGLGQGAVALMLESKSSARARGAQALACIEGCELALDDDMDHALRTVTEQLPGSRNPDLVWSWSSGDSSLGRVERDFWKDRSPTSVLSSAQTVGVLLNAGALLNLCLTCHLFSRSEDRATASTFALEQYWAQGAGGAVLTRARP